RCSGVGIGFIGGSIRNGRVIFVTAHLATFCGGRGRGICAVLAGLVAAGCRGILPGGGVGRVAIGGAAIHFARKDLVECAGIGRFAILFATAGGRRKNAEDIADRGGAHGVPGWLSFVQQASCRVFVHLLLVALVFPGLLCLVATLGEGAVRHALAFASLPRLPFALHGQLGIADHQLLAGHGLVQLADELLVVGIGHGAQSRAQAVLKARHVVVAIL